MLDHHIQRQIVTTLRLHDQMSFTELKPKDLDNKLFTYHLKIVIREGYVEKSPEMAYRLTAAGEKLWKRISESPQAISLRAFSIIIMVIRHKNNGWLLCRRKTHPVKDRIAFIHCIPKGNEPIIKTAVQETSIRTGLDCEFKVVGSGFFHTYDEEQLDGFTNFTLLACEDARGDLTPNDEHAEYFWDKNPDFMAPDMLPNMKPLIDHYNDAKFPFFLDEIVKL